MNRKSICVIFSLAALFIACRGSARTAPAPTASSQTATAATQAPAESFIDPVEASNGSRTPFSPLSRVQHDITYCTLDGVDLKMDIYHPANAASNTALVIFIHGGGWSGGDKLDGRQTFEIPALVAAGYTAASLNYRLAPEHQFPVMIEDVKCAIRSFRAHAQDYNINPDRIGVWGASAGGHLVSLLGLTDENAGFERGEYLDQSSRVQAVVDLFGPANLTTDFSTAYIELKDSVFGDFDLVKASPITYASPDDPPFLILQGDRDPVVPLNQSQLLHEALIAAGVDSQLVIVTNGNHGFTRSDMSPSREEITQMILEFFDHHLK